MERRHFLQLLAATSAVGLSGCCRQNKFITPAQLDVAPRPIFPGMPADKGDKLDLAFDAHVHVFNGSDMQAAGYFRGPVLRGMDASAPVRKFVEALADIVHLLVKLAPSAYREINALNQRSLDAKALSQGRMLLADELVQAEAIKKSLRKYIKGDLYDAYLESTLSVTRRHTKDLRTLQQREEEVGYLRDSREGHLDAVVDSYYGFGAFDEFDLKQMPAPSQKQHDLVRTLQEDGDKAAGGETPLGYLRFVTALLSYRFTNIRRYREGFSTGKDAFGVDACFAAMVDFDYWLGKCDKPLTRFKDQVELMHRLAIAFEGFMIPVVAYNPWPEDGEHEASMAILEDAVTNKGFVGVKIYPPIGYKPAQNVPDQYHFRDKVPADMGALNDALGVFFKRCRDLDIPVMAHANRSMGEYTRGTGTGGTGQDYRTFTGPDAWKAFFETEPVADKVARQRLSLGHAGGLSDWKTPENNWTYRFFSDSKAINARYVFGDLGYWTDIFKEGKPQDNAVAALKAVAALELDSGTWQPGRVVRGIDRLLFGSDWMMMIKEGGWASYPGDVYDSLLGKDRFSKQDLRRIYDVNVLELYGLPQWNGSGTEGANFGRLKDYYQKYGIDPAWFRRVQTRRRDQALGL